MVLTQSGRIDGRGHVVKLMVVAPFPPYRGGIAQFATRLDTALVQEGSVRLLEVSYKSPLYPGFLAPGRSGQADSVFHTRRVLSSHSPWRWLSERCLLGDAARGAGVDIVLVHWWHSFFAPCLLATLPSGLPRVVVCHNARPHSMSFGWKLLTQVFLRTCSLVVAHDATTAVELARLSGDAPVLRLFHPTYTHYSSFGSRSSNLRHCTRLALGLGSRELVVLAFGLVRGHKGLGVLAEACRRVGARLLVVGESYLNQREEGHLRVLLASSGALWVDRFVKEDEVAQYFEAADVVALPYLTGSQSGVAAIARAFGKVLVVTRVGGLVENVDEVLGTGFVAEPGNVESLAGALRYALMASSEPGMRERVLEADRGRDWGSYTRRLLQAIGEENLV